MRSYKTTCDECNREIKGSVGLADDETHVIKVGSLCLEVNIIGDVCNDCAEEIISKFCRGELKDDMIRELCTNRWVRIP